MNIFQIKYQSTKYDDFYAKNKKLLPSLQIYDDSWIDDFIAKYDYVDVIDSFKIVPLSHFTKYKKSFFCDLLRILILYEFGGIYIDSDVWFTKDIVNLYSYMQHTYKDNSVIFNDGSLYFIYVPQAKNKFITAMKNLYTSGCAITLDREMTKRLPEDSLIDLCRIHKESLYSYFKHI